MKAIKQPKTHKKQDMYNDLVEKYTNLLKQNKDTVDENDKLKDTVEELTARVHELEDENAKQLREIQYLKETQYFFSSDFCTV